jgi:small basic protein
MHRPNIDGMLFLALLFYELTYLGQKLSLVSYMALPLVLGLNGVKSSVK